MAATSPLPSEQNDVLEPSELGTKEYWDTLYARELANHTSTNAEDEGTIWFDESNAEATVIRELDALADEGVLDRRRARFLDLGTGNGHMLFALRWPELDSDDDVDEDGERKEDGDGCDSKAWHGELVGVDYSATSVDLARRIAAQRHAADAISSSSLPSDTLRFETWDLLLDPPGSWLSPASTFAGPDANARAFDVVLDKGTFDAISLMPRPSTDSSDKAPVNHPCTVYREKVLPLIRPNNGLLVITSCNWTKEELVAWLAPSATAATTGIDDGNQKGGKERKEGDDGLELFREATYPSFTFGGKKGQSVVTLIFRRQGRKCKATI